MKPGNKPHSTKVTNKRPLGIGIIGHFITWVGLLMVLYLFGSFVWNNLFAERYTMWIHERSKTMPPATYFFIVQVIFGIAFLKLQRWAYVIILAVTCLFLYGGAKALYQKSTQMPAPLRTTMIAFIALGFGIACYLLMNRVRASFRMSTKCICVLIFSLLSVLVVGEIIARNGKGGTRQNAQEYAFQSPSGLYRLEFDPTEEKWEKLKTERGEINQDLYGQPKNEIALSINWHAQQAGVGFEQFFTSQKTARLAFSDVSWQSNAESEIDVNGVRALTGSYSYGSSFTTAAFIYYEGNAYSVSVGSQRVLMNHAEHLPTCARLCVSSVQRLANLN